MPEIAGLTAVLPRLLALGVGEETGVTAAMHRKWEALLARIPALPTAACKHSTYNADCFVPGKSLPPTASNAENAELYAVHPYRVSGMHSNRARGVATFYARRFSGDTGWSEDFMDAALLGLANETATEAVNRANVQPYEGYRWCVRVFCLACVQYCTRTQSAWCYTIA